MWNTKDVIAQRALVYTCFNIVYQDNRDVTDSFNKNIVYENLYILKQKYNEFVVFFLNNVIKFKKSLN